MSRGQLTVLWSLAVVIVLIFAALTYVLSRLLPPAQLLEERPATAPVSLVPQPAGGPAGAEIYLLPEVPHSARALYERAEQAAKEWRSDAGLVSAVASWPFATLDDLSEPVDWTFSFFSPGTQSVYVLNVHPNRITSIRETLSPYPLPVIAVDLWRVDSYEALNAWLNDGGGDFLRSHPVVDVSARLGVEDGRASWTVIGARRGDAVQEEQPSWVVILDAADGARVN